MFITNSFVQNLCYQTFVFQDGPSDVNEGDLVNQVSIDFRFDPLSGVFYVFYDCCKVPWQLPF